MLDFKKEDFIEDIARANLSLPYEAMDKLMSLMKLVFDNYPKEDLDNALDISRLHLLSRLYNDLKSIYLLSLNGYSVQAATIACAFYEAALTVVFIDTEKKGKKWLQHDKREHGYSNTGNLKKEVVKKLNWSSETHDILKKFYTDLSMAKHSNPLILTVHSFVEVNDIEGSYKGLNYGPEFSEASFRLSWYSVIMSMQLGSTALAAYVDSLAELIEDQLFINEIQELHSEFLDLLRYNIRVSAQKYGQLKP